MVLKTIQDYYDELLKEFPNIPLSDIKKICQYGFKSLYLNNSYGGDVLLSGRKFWIYFGKLMNDSYKFFKYYRKKTSVKLRVLYNRNKIEWDGYYYFALKLAEYDQYIKPTGKRGRPKTKHTFKNVVLYKIFDECNIMENGSVAIMRVPFILQFGFSKFLPEFSTNKARLYLLRPPLKMQDILKINYKYLYGKKGNN